MRAFTSPCGADATRTTAGEGYPFSGTSAVLADPPCRPLASLPSSRDAWQRSACRASEASAVGGDFDLGEQMEPVLFYRRHDRQAIPTVLPE